MIVALLGCSQQLLQARQAVTIQQQNEARGKSDVSAHPQQPATPTRVTVDGPVTVVNQPDPKQDQRDAEQRAQTKFDNRIDVLTLVLLGAAAAGAVGAYLANRRSANAAEAQVRLLSSQIADAKKDAAEQRQIAFDALAETRKSAEAAVLAARTADREMRLVHQQWLDFDQWRVENASADGAFYLDTRFQITNNTPMKVTVTTITIRCIDKGHEAESDSASAFDLPPRTNYPGNAPLYRVNEDSPEEVARYINGALRITLVGEIKFIDAFEDERIQRFGCLLVGGRANDSGTPWEVHRFDASLQHFMPPPNRQQDQSRK